MRWTLSVLHKCIVAIAYQLFSALSQHDVIFAHNSTYIPVLLQHYWSLIIIIVIIGSLLLLSNIFFTNFMWCLSTFLMHVLNEWRNTDVPNVGFMSSAICGSGYFLVVSCITVALYRMLHRIVFLLFARTCTCIAKEKRASGEASPSHTLFLSKQWRNFDLDSLN